MTMNGLPYKEYRGWFIGRGITMPAQGIYEINIYSDIGKCAAEDPDYRVDSMEKAEELVDELERKKLGYI